jgi:plastocyanin
MTPGSGGTPVDAPTTGERRQVAIEIVAGRDGATFRPADLVVPTGALVVWTNRTDQVQVVAFGRRVVILAALDQAGAVARTRLSRPGTFGFVLQSHPAAQLIIRVTDPASGA